MNITVLILENSPKGFFVQASEEYIKRLGRFCRIYVRYYKNSSKLAKDAGSMNNLFVIDPSGVMMSSVELAESIQKMEINGISRITIVIADDITKAMNSSAKKIALSRMYMPPALAGTVALEQIYRAFKIIRGETYHK